MLTVTLKQASIEHYIKEITTEVSNNPISKLKHVTLILLSFI